MTTLEGTTWNDGVESDIETQEDEGMQDFVANIWTASASEAKIELPVPNRNEQVESDLNQNVYNTFRNILSGHLDANLLQQHLNMAIIMAGKHDGPAHMATLLNKLSTRAGVDAMASYDKLSGTFKLRIGQDILKVKLR